MRPVEQLKINITAGRCLDKKLGRFSAIFLGIRTGIFFEQFRIQNAFIDIIAVRLRKLIIIPFPEIRQKRLDEDTAKVRPDDTRKLARKNLPLIGIMRHVYTTPQSICSALSREKQSC